MDTITLADLANVVYYSPWYSYRIFTELTNITQAGYIRKLKLSNSALKLRDGKIKIFEIALKYGYDSVDRYQRAFYKEFGCNPHEYFKYYKEVGCDVYEVHFTLQLKYTFIV